MELAQDPVKRYSVINTSGFEISASVDRERYGKSSNKSVVEKFIACPTVSLM
jgi:hypothetical protein